MEVYDSFYDAYPQFTRHVSNTFVRRVSKLIDDEVGKIERDGSHSEDTTGAAGEDEPSWIPILRQYCDWKTLNSTSAQRARRQENTERLIGTQDSYSTLNEVSPSNAQDDQSRVASRFSSRTALGSLSATHSNLSGRSLQVNASFN